MAKKKAVEAQNEGDAQQTTGEESIGSIDDAEQLRVTETEYLRITLQRARMDMAEEIKSKLEYQDVVMQAKYQKDRDVLRGKMFEAQQSKEQARREYDRVLGNINGRLGIDLLKYILKDDFTLHLADE